MILALPPAAVSNNRFGFHPTMNHPSIIGSLLLATLATSSALTIDDFKPTALSGSGKTLELSIEGDGNGPNPGPTWTLTFDKTPANQATVRDFPGYAAASTTTWAYTGPPFQDAHGYAFTATNAFGNKPASIEFWISEPGARFIVYYDGKSYYGGVALKPSAAPEISVQQPAGSELADGKPKSKRSFGSVKVGKAGKAKLFTIKNYGTANLTGLSVKKDGAAKGDFTVSQPAKTTLAAGESTKFKVTFSPSAKGMRKAALHIKSNDSDENPFDIGIAGEGVK